MERQVRFCKTVDGVRIAYATYGSGSPLVYVPGWISHIDLDWQIPAARESAEALGRHFSCVHLDKRGTGLSDRGLDDYSIEARVRDVEAVVDHLGLDQFYLSGISEGGPTCISYAAKHPDRVTKMFLYGTFARGAGLAGGSTEMQAAIKYVVKAEWGVGSKLLGDFFLGPDADPNFHQIFAQYQQAGATAEDALPMLEADIAIDVSDLLPAIKAPTLVVHSRDDRIVPIELGRELAAGLPDARFATIDGPHVPFDQEQSRKLQQLELEFLLEGTGVAAAASQPAPGATAAPGGLVTILFTDMESSTALTQRLGDEKAQELVRSHNTAVRDALKAYSGSEIKHTGDGIMASFPSARGALDAAIAIQRSLSGAEGPRVRVGLNAGEPVAEERDLFGTSVQLAARVCNEAEPGQILVSNVVRELAAGKQFLFSDRGDVALRGFEDPVRLYEVSWQESE
jgi:class 3 adenylate cyclase/pimeloyl-ACP methyl ester carboxylesterase